MRPTDATHRVTTLELFFDLVFVFAITQVTALMAEELSARGLYRGLLVLALLWFAWCSYAWLGNQAIADEGLLRAAMIVAMGGLFLAALAIPEAWEDASGGVSAPLVLAGAMALVRLVHLVVYTVAAGDDAGLRAQLARTALAVVPAFALLLAGAFVDGSARTALWTAAVVLDYVGIFAGGAKGWRVPAPIHFAERHGLIVLIALGESIVAVGVGAEDYPLSAPVLVAATLALAATVALWWLYFDVVAPVAERVLVSTPEGERARLARDSYTYLHFPMVAGVIYLALGLKKVLQYVGDTEHHDLGDPIPTVAAFAMYGGVAAYMLAHVAFRKRNVHTWNPHRIAVAVLLLVLMPLAAELPGLVSLALLMAVLLALTGYESLRFAAARDAVRHAAPHH